MNAILRLVIFLCVAGSVGAEIRMPQPGAPERKAILDALRPPLSKLAGSDVKFLHPDIRVSDGWALVQSRVVDDKERQLSGQFKLGYAGLAQQVNGTWKLRSWIFSDNNAVGNVRKQCPDAPASVFGAISSAQQKKSPASKGFYLDERGIPVVYAYDPPPQWQDDAQETPPPEQKPRPRKFTSWPDGGQGPQVSYIWKAVVWEKIELEDGTSIVGFVPECDVMPKPSNAVRRKLERLKIQLKLPSDMATFFVPFSVDQAASEVCSIGFNRNGEIRHVTMWYERGGYEVSDGNLIIRCRSYHGDDDRRLLAKAVFTPSVLENLKPQVGISSRLVAFAKDAAKKLRRNLPPFPEGENQFTHGNDPALYVDLSASGKDGCFLSIGENGDGGEDWLEPLAVPVPAAAPASSKSTTKKSPAPRVGTK